MFLIFLDPRLVTVIFGISILLKSTLIFNCVENLKFQELNDLLLHYIHYHACWSTHESIVVRIDCINGRSIGIADECSSRFFLCERETRVVRTGDAVGNGHTFVRYRCAVGGAVFFAQWADESARQDPPLCFFLRRESRRHPRRMMMMGYGAKRVLEHGRWSGSRGSNYERKARSPGCAPLLFVRRYIAQLSSMRSTITGNTLHELRTPLYTNSAKVLFNRIPSSVSQPVPNRRIGFSISFCFVFILRGSTTW